MAAGHRGLVCLVLMCIVIAWRGSAFVGRSSIQNPGSRRQPQSRNGISRLAAGGEQQNLIDEEELEFLPGQQVALLGPRKLAGKKGTIVGPASGNTFAVRLESGSVFHIQTENIKDAKQKAGIFQMFLSFFGQTRQSKKVTSEHAAPSVSKPIVDSPQLTEAPPVPVAASAAVTRPAGAEEDDIEFVPGQSVIVLAPPNLAGSKGTFLRPALGDTAAVRLESGSIFHIPAENLRDATSLATQQSEKQLLDEQDKTAVQAPAQTKFVPAAPQAATSPTTKELPTEESGELEFTPGQRVALLGPSKLAGKKGIIVGSALDDTFAVRLESGSVFHIKAENIKDAKQAPNNDVFQSMFSNVKQGVMQQARGLKSAVSFKVPAFPTRGPKIFTETQDTPALEAGKSTEGKGVATPVPSLSKLSASQAQSADDALEFAPRQEVVVLAPPKLAGTKGTIVGPTSSDTFAVRLESGSIFNIPTENLRDAKQAAGPGFLGKLLKGARRATSLGFFRTLSSRVTQTFGRWANRPAPVVTTVQADSQKEVMPRVSEPVTAATPTEQAAELDSEMELTPGQSVVVLAPPAVAGKAASVVSRVAEDVYAVQLESGSVFHIEAANLQIVGGGGLFAAGGGGAGAGGGSGTGGSGRGGSGDGMPPDNIGSGQTDPESRGGSSPLWLLVAILAALMAVIAERRERLRHRSPTRVVRLPAIQGGSPASMDPLLAILVMATAVVAVLLTKFALQAWEEMPEILKAIMSWFRAARANISGAMEEVAEQVAKVEIPVAPSQPPSKASEEAAGSHLHYLCLLVVLIAVVAIAIAARRRRKARLGKDQTKKTDLAVVKEGQIEPEAEPEEPPKPHEDCPEVHLRVIMLVAKCRLFVAGDCESTGAWNPENSIVELKTNKLSHPVWTGKWHPRAETSSREFQFKLVLLRPDGQVLWEDVENRKLLVNPREKISVEITFNRAGMQVSHVP
eukprot:TRINITY_DN1696_c2_g1_i1.p1 TRINITY_DN1696_c2_g1~~TRINITY_DN1696_c2_g1_i1.p1  ORF type:complete len:966 (-),score=181.61 TRINITY_DN1696_c2_g1_i1:92-2989(-)